MTILLPAADKITLICTEAIKRRIPFACLVPYTLINRISQRTNGEIDNNIEKQVQLAQNIILLTPELNWLICFGLPKITTKVMFNSEIETENMEEEFNNLQVDLDLLLKNMSDNDPFPQKH